MVHVPDLAAPSASDVTMTAGAMVIMNLCPWSRNRYQHAFVDKYTQIAVNRTETGPGKDIPDPMEYAVCRGMVPVAGNSVHNGQFLFRPPSACLCLCLHL